MTIKKLVAVVLGVRPRGVRRVPITPEFGVRITLREGDNDLVMDDSRSFGVADVEARVLLRWWPRPGRLPAR